MSSPSPGRAPSPSSSGVGACLGACAIFGLIFMIPPLLHPLDPQQVLGYRIVLTIAFLAVLFTAMRLWADVAALLRRCRRRPALVVVIAVNAALMGAQLWLFGWAPQTGHGLQVSLGYLILPLVMVLVGVVVHGERVSVLRASAVALAAVGVLVAVLVTGGLGWPTLLVAGGFPLYFLSRRAFGVNSSGAQLLELVAMAPLAVWGLTSSPSWQLVLDRPALGWGLVLLGALSAAGFSLYLYASRALSFALFGVLGYAEPVLLVVVSLAVLGEAWRWEDLLVYGPICAGLGLLVVEAVRTRRSSTFSGSSASLQKPHAVRTTEVT